MEYNSQRKHLHMKEHGRYVQSMVDYLFTIEDKEKRNHQAKIVVELMAILNPQLKNIEDFKQMLWDHLFVISNFQLDVDSPYPKPTKETYKEKPSPLAYPRRYPKYAHLGKNLELVIEKALEEEDAEKKACFAHTIAYYMKLAYSNWHKELVHDELIRSELNNLTGGSLEFGATPYIKHRNQERGEFSAASTNRKQGFNNRSGGKNNNNTNRPRKANNRNNNNNRNFKNRF